MLHFFFGVGCTIFFVAIVLAIVYSMMTDAYGK